MKLSMMLLVLLASVGCGGTQLDSTADNATVQQACRVATGYPQGCLVLSGVCSCAILGPEAIITFPAAVSAANVAWVSDTTNEESIIIKQVSVQNGAVHLGFKMADGSPLPGGAFPGMAGWWWDVTGQ